MTQTGPDVTLAGAATCAPDFRICELGKLDGKPEAGTELTLERSDVISVEVTRVNSGFSHYLITLNNWTDILPGQRRDEPRLDWPPFKYNDFKKFRFGKRLRIDMRSQPDSGWVPMIAGPITDLKYTFASQQGARLVVTGEDDVYLLKTKSRAKVPFKKKAEEWIIKKVLEDLAGYPLTLRNGEAARPSFFTNDAKGVTESLGEGQSYWDFLKKIADRFDCEIFVEFDNLDSKKPAVELHFERARSRRSPKDEPSRLFVLERGKNLIDFTPSFKILDQYTEVTVKGRHRLPGRRKRVENTQLPSILSDELYWDAAKGDPEVVPGSKIREESLKNYFPERFIKNPFTLPNQTNLDEERAAEMAGAKLRQNARQFIKIVGTTVGLPRLRPGVYVEIRNMRAPFNGFYYVEKTVSKHATQGVTTQFTARRPGMPLPPAWKE